MPDTLTTAQTLYFAERLRHTYSEIIKAPMPALKTFELFETDTEPTPGMEEVAQEFMTSVGSARMSNLSSADVPKVNVGMTRDLQPLRAVDAGYDYNLKEQLAALAAGEGTVLFEQRRVATRDAILRKMDAANVDGDTDWGIHGLLTLPYIPRTAVADGFDSGTTAEAMVNMVLDFLLVTWDLTHGEVAPRVLLMPTAAFKYINSHLYDPDVPGNFIIDQIKAAYRGFIGGELDIQPWYRLDSPNYLVAYTKDKRKQRVIVPGGVFFEELEPTRTGPVWEVYCYGLTGGFASNFPLEMNIGEIPA